MLQCVSLWNVKLPGDPTSMVNMYVQSMSLEMTVVSCNVINTDGHLRGLIFLYSGSTVIHKISMPDPVTCIAFGRFGQEENALIMISISEYLYPLSTNDKQEFNGNLVLNSKYVRHRFFRT